MTGYGKTMSACNKKLSACAENWRPRYASVSGKPRRMRGATRKPIRSVRAENRAATMADKRAARSRRAYMNGSVLPCRNAARIAAAGWSRKAAKPNIKKRSSGAQSCAVSISP